MGMDRFRRGPAGQKLVFHGLEEGCRHVGRRPLIYCRWGGLRRGCVANAVVVGVYHEAKQQKVDI